MIPFAVAVLAALAPAGVDVLFPDGARAARLRVAVTVEGRPPEAAWGEFLGRLFDHFDRDGDGFLSAAEAARVFPLPLPGGREVAAAFTRLDADTDGKATRAEFRQFYRTSGFAPVVTVVRPPTVDQRRLSDALFRHLDRDRDGVVTRAELDKASTLLRRLDENEDEVLTAAELLTREPEGEPVNAESSVKTAAVGVADAVLHLAVGKVAKPVELESRGKAFVAGREPGEFGVPGGRATVSPPAADAVTPFRTAKAFYLAQFTSVLGTRTGLGKEDVDADPGLQAVGAMFPAADRDGDGKLTAAELRAFLDLVEAGVGCQAVVTVEDRGGDLFGLMDRNADGRLDLGELNAAAALAGAPLRRAEIPTRFRLSVSQGPVGPAFGPVPLPAAATPKPAATPAVAGGPRWFRSMDRNGDGFVSPAEFVGRRELFRKLDTDGDGWISAAEADAAGRPD